MSIVSNVHDLFPLTAKSAPFDGQRLARVIAKKDKDGNYPSPNLQGSLCVSVPPIAQADVVENIDALLPHLMRMLEDAQDALIRDAVVKNAAKQVTDQDISVVKCIEWMSEEGSGRITKEYLQQWFSETYGEPCKEFICTLLKWEGELTQDQDKLVQQKSAVLRDIFSSYSSGKYEPDTAKCNAMVRFGEFLGEENWDASMRLYQEKTQKHIKRIAEEMSANALGF